MWESGRSVGEDLYFPLFPYLGLPLPRLVSHTQTLSVEAELTVPIIVYVLFINVYGFDQIYFYLITPIKDK